MKTLQWKMESAIGPLHLVASATELRGVHWRPRPDVPFAASLANPAPEAALLARAAAELAEFLRGERRFFSVPLGADGTDFEREAWRQLARIPYAETISYAELARRVGNAKAMRAVGSANGRNPLAIIVPCHRVIASDGSLGGYAGGLEVKRRLLDLERAILSEGRSSSGS